MFWRDIHFNPKKSRVQFYIFVAVKARIAIFLTLLLSSSFLANLGVLVWYQVEYNTIVTELCINKDVAESNCHGCCVLNDNLQSQSPQQDVPGTVPNFKLLSFIFPSSIECKVEREENKPSPNLLINTLEGYPSPTFHPPAII
ncbi:hypothetical protein GYB29_07565 [bacterium]|nr:hypothetical protein [bacterium]